MPPIRGEHARGSTAVDEFLTVARTVGKAPSVVLSFSDFATAPPIAGLDAVSAFGADPIVTWEPWRWIEGGTYDSSGFALQSIVDGVHDDYLYRWADELTAWGKPVYLRFAHEPNGTWYPWSVAAGTPADVYVAAWRHVHDLFATRRAHNVKWVWSPNVSFPGSSSTGATYPETTTSTWWVWTATTGELRSRGVTGSRRPTSSCRPWTNCAGSLRGNRNS